MVDLFLLGVCFVVRFADTLGDYLRVALAMAGILAVGTLHPSSILQKVATKRATHDIVELLCNEFVPLLLVDLFLLLSNRTLTIETNVERPSVLQLFGYTPISIRKKTTRIVF